MHRENRTKDDVAKLLRFSSWLKYTQNCGKLQNYVSENVRLISEFEADKFVKLEQFVKALILIVSAELPQHQLSNLSA
eukprot:7306485-Pyramimonas_sp.AAC.1